MFVGYLVRRSILEQLELVLQLEAIAHDELVVVNVGENVWMNAFGRVTCTRFNQLVTCSLDGSCRGPIDVDHGKSFILFNTTI